MLKWIFLIYIKKQTILTCLLKTAISSLNDSDEHTSPPAIPGSLGVLVANSHFSNINASRGNSGCLEKNCLKKILVIFQSTLFGFFNSKFLLSDKFDKETQTLYHKIKKSENDFLRYRTV